MDLEFVNVRKWAQEKGFKVTDWDDQRTITIQAGEKRFVLQQRESTIYRSVRGIKGNPKGLYLSGVWKYAFKVASQKEAIQEMERVLGL